MVGSTKNRLVVWIIGTNSSGKSTLAKSLHKKLLKVYGKSFDVKYIQWIENDKKCAFTQFSPYSSNLGKMDKTACGGADTLNSKEQIINSLKKALSVTPIVMVDAIMATSTYLDFLKTERRAVFLIHLDIDEKANLERLRTRRAIKAGIDPSAVEITRETKEKLASKRTTFRNLYLKAKDKVDYAIQLKTESLSPQEVQEKVWKAFSEYIDQSF